MNIFGSVFGWLRTAARNAVLAGVGDAMEQLSHGTPADLEQAANLSERLALPGPVVGEEDNGEVPTPVRRRGKART